jgi:hypothetical protein
LGSVLILDDREHRSIAALVMDTVKDQKGGAQNGIATGDCHRGRGVVDSASE